ncbi:MAG: M23 family metallopeptidase, partial [Paraclostridium sp.]
KMYGFDKIIPDIASAPQDQSTTSIDIDPNSPKVADDWFTRVLNGRMTSPYGPRKHPVTGELGKMHTGVDYGAGGGTPILSPVAGTVISNVSQSTGYGNHLRLQDEYGGVHLFAHMQKKSPLNVGSKVDLNDSVGVVGTTGSSTGNHLHYEIRKSDDKNAHVEPNGYLSAYLDKLYNKSKPKSQTSTGPRVAEKPKLDLKPASLNGKGGVDSPINESNMFKNNVNSVQPQNNNLDKELLLAIIKVLEKIASNTNSLSEIVTLITKALNIPKDQIDKIEKTKESNPTQVINVIKDSIKGSDPNNTNLLNILNELAKQ